MNTLGHHLAQLRRELARLPRWSDAWMVAWLRLTHLEAESLRREAGWSCGCALCQSILREAEGVVISLDRSHGRPRVLTPQDEANIRRLAAKGQGARAIGRELAGQGIEVSLPTISRRLRELRP